MRQARAPAAGGFTLLEILISIAIFAFVAGAAMQTMANADYMAASGHRARQLRMLAERKLGEILAFEEHYDDSFDGDFSDWEEYGEQFDDWKWQLEVRGTPGPPFVVFGVSPKEDAQYLFGAPTEEEKAEATGTGTGTSGGSSQPGQTQKKGETQELRELTLRVSAPSDGGVSDSVEIVLFARVIPAPAAKTTR